MLFITPTGPGAQPNQFDAAGVLEYMQRMAPEFVPGVEALSLARDLFLRKCHEAFDVRTKSHGDFQCALDVELDELFHRYLRHATPNIPLLSEEFEGRQRLDQPWLWVVDPLDATSAFLYRTSPEHPSIMVSLLRNGEPYASVVHFPATNEWFYAVKGKGAFKNGQQLVTHDCEKLLHSSRVILNRYADAQFETAVFSYLDYALRRPTGMPAGLVTAEAPHSGAACRVVDPASRVCAVLHDNNPAQPKQLVWDLAAPKLLIEEAGGVFWDLEGKPYPLTGTSPILVAHSAAIGERFVQAAAVHRVMLLGQAGKGRTHEERRHDV